MAEGLLEIARFQQGYRMAGLFARFGRKRGATHVEIHTSRIVAKSDLQIHIKRSRNNSQFSSITEIAYSAHFHLVVTVGNVSKYTLRRLIRGLPGDRLCASVGQFQQSLTVEVNAAALREHMEINDSCARGSVVSVCGFYAAAYRSGAVYQIIILSPGLAKWDCGD